MNVVAFLEFSGIGPTAPPGVGGVLGGGLDLLAVDGQVEEDEGGMHQHVRNRVAAPAVRRFIVGLNTISTSPN